ncbi:Sjogren's syndrome/scleroderma autoantigen 1 family protein [Halodesulfurarchaeum sp.]|uniref:Sjogren's syndrome/scleroderma autoantigen 1 family protein n=1 Tax=Halodesulfurarchaeum sp. TaxID=1980530 RepID=UPI001BBF8D32|nr:hypothetical protein [Halodesulfurarchaeum sp.]
MSENFDKEAERERLREKYESDSADREVTERMSQLLLQGATMTNKHCDTCGSPIFRYQGQEFCPTCQAEAQGGEKADAQHGGETGAQDGEEATAQDGDTATAEQPTSVDQAGSTDQRADPESVSGSASSVQTDPAAHKSVGAASTGTAELGGAQQTQATQPATESGGVSVTGSQQTAAETSLSETIVSLSNRARESEDPHQAKALLEAAREAAETLATLHGR